MTADEFRDIYRELIDENPLAIRAVLKVLRIEFTATVPTLAVSCEAEPRLLVNLRFVGEHCRTDAEVKAVICHEFLHVLLRHTERFTSITPELHLATDAVINAIIHRTLGGEYSRMMGRYYAECVGIRRLLRSPRAEEVEVAQDRPLLNAWRALYDGTLVVDDIEDLARDYLRVDPYGAGQLIGNHDRRDGNGRPGGGSGSAVLDEAIERALQSMNGDGIFRSPRPGVGAAAYQCHVRAVDPGLTRWRRETYAVLKRYLEPDPRSAVRESDPRSFTLPVLSAGDRRAALRAIWSPFLPDAQWQTSTDTRTGSAQVYLDVSGSMNAEMPLIVALLGQLTRHIRRPFWAFSNEVSPARIEGGVLVSNTTGGTSMGCVLEHLAQTRPAAAVVVTDGYIEALTKQQVAAASATRLHVIVTRDGNPAELTRAGLAYTQLSKVQS